MDNYERNVDKAVNAVEKVAGAANRLRLGCIMIFANLFFAGFCLWGVYAGYIGWKLQTEGVSSTGTIVRLDERSDSDGGCCTYVPIVEFTATDRKTYSFEGGTASYPPQYEVNEEVPVLYDPADPGTAQIDSVFERWLLPVILIPTMIFAALILNFIMIRAWRRGEYPDNH